MNASSSVFRSSFTCIETVAARNSLYLGRRRGEGEEEKEKEKEKKFTENKTEKKEHKSHAAHALLV